MTVSKKYNDNLVAGGAVRDSNGNRIDTTYAKIANLASVATTGNYNDLTNKPGIDLNYDGTSNNAQSGIAVEQAINTVKRNIGEVVTSTIPLTDAGLHLLDGSLISGEGVYSEFVEYIKQFNIFIALNTESDFKISGSHSVFTSGGQSSHYYGSSNLDNPFYVYELPTLSNPQVSIYDKTGNLIQYTYTEYSNGTNSSTTTTPVYLFYTESGYVLVLGESLTSSNGVNAVLSPADNSNLGGIFTTESDWQNSVTTYGVCGKFVYDNVNNTVRLPKITGFTEGTTDVNTLGDLTEAGLPNITGTVAGIWDGSHSGAFNNVTHSGDLFDRDEGGGKGNWGTASFNAQSSNSIYGNSTTVQPQSVKILYYIVVANKTKTDIEVDIDEIITDLNGKAGTDLSNLSATGQKVIDSQWVLNGITANTSTALGTYTIDLSTYLPNDGYTYEVICNTRISRGDTSSSGGTNTNYRIQDNSQTITWSQIEADYSNFQQANDSFIVIVGSERALKLVISGLKCDGAYTRFMAYRRIGTNS